MTSYVLRRLLVAPLLLRAVSFIVFFLIRLVPGDPAEAMAGEKASPEMLAKLRERWALDQPIIVQYGLYVKRVVLEGDLGESYVRNKPIAEEIGERLPPTIELTVAAMLISLFAGVALGVLSAVKKGSWIDYAGSVFALLGVSVPVYWLGLLLLLAFGSSLATGGNLSAELTHPPEVTGLLLVDTLLAGDINAFADALRHLVLPAIALSTIPLALIARITRSSMLDVLESDYVRTARAKGLAPDVVIMSHALRNALIPIVTLAGLEFGYLLGGAVLTETVFKWPGMGTYIVDSLENRDYMAIQGAVTTLAGIFVLVNLFVDILYAFIDPRIRYA